MGGSSIHTYTAVSAKDQSLPFIVGTHIDTTPIQQWTENQKQHTQWNRYDSGIL